MRSVLLLSPADPTGEEAKTDPQFVTLSDNEHKTVQLKLAAPQNQ